MPLCLQINTPGSVDKPGLSAPESFLRLVKGRGRVAEKADLVGKGMPSATKQAKRVYKALLAEAQKEGGQSLADFVTLLRPSLDLLGAAPERVVRLLARAYNRVPAERQIHARPSIAVPILAALCGLEDDNILTELCLNLLARAVDTEREQEVHPAFVKVIEQLASDEVLILGALRRQSRRYLYRSHLPALVANNLILVAPEHYELYVDHLCALNILRPERAAVSLSFRDLPVPSSPEYDSALRAILQGLQESVERRTRTVETTKFGDLFLQACLPKDLDLKSFQQEVLKTELEEKL